MAYAKSKETRVVTDAKKRYAGMVEIDTQKGSEVEYGDAVSNPCNATVVSGKIEEYNQVQQALNQILSNADETANQLKAIEKIVGSLYTRTLSGAVSKFGEDSNEIEMLGGTRKSERKRPVRTPVP